MNRVLVTGLALVFIAVLGAIASLADRPSRGGNAPLSWSAAYDQQLRSAFSVAEGRPDAPYTLVLRYFLTSFLDRQRIGGAAADQPGARSRHGANIDAMEGFSRLAPVAAAWLAGGRPPVLQDLRDRSVDLADWLADGIAAGTDPSSRGYWGDIGDFDQRIVEAADIARTLWIAREFLTPRLGAERMRYAADWLRQAEARRVPDNNWHLYPVLIHEVLTAFGQGGDPDRAAAHFQRFEEFSQGDGWFTDGPNPEAVDWYNAWGIHYELAWIRRISPGYGGERVARALQDFLKPFPYLIGIQGIPILGRSLCYRMAAPAPLISASVFGLDEATSIDPGLARHALDAVWRFFVARGAFADGVVTQGYCGTDLRLLDNYSGPSSCLWSLRPLVFAFLASPDAPFWTSPERPLPVEEASYEIDIPAVGWLIRGDAESYDIRIRRQSSDRVSASTEIEEFGLLRRLASAVLWRPFRPDNSQTKYLLEEYSSNDPFCGCAAPARLVSHDLEPAS